MARGRPRKPTKLLEASGAFKKDPLRGRERANEPAADTPLGPPPKRLTKTEREAWAELVANAHEGVLCAADGLLLEMAARLLAESWTARESFSVQKIKTLADLLGKLGMTPSDRSRVQVSKPEGGAGHVRNRFAALRRRALGA